MKSALANFLSNSSQISLPLEMKIFDTLYVSILCATTRTGRTFFDGGVSDLDRGGWVLPELCRNFDLCSAEKKEKVQAYKSRYREWWLALVNHVSCSLDESEKMEIYSRLQISRDWDKVVVINPLNVKDSVEIALDPS